MIKLNFNFQTSPPGFEEPAQLQCWILNLNFPNNSMEDPKIPILYIVEGKAPTDPKFFRCFNTQIIPQLRLLGFQGV